jgi:hypothetical protein
MTMYDDDVDEGVASKGVPCRDRDRGSAAAPAIAPAGVEIVLLTECAAAVEGTSPTGVPAGRLSLTDRYLRQTGAISGPQQGKCLDSCGNLLHMLLIYVCWCKHIKTLLSNCL